jgi:ubiquitin carboxyl-terminal hydrolase 34
MDLWVVSFISNPQIKKEFYVWEKEVDKVVMNQPEQQTVGKLIKKSLPRLIITNTAELILGGLFSSKGQSIRKKFQESVEMICERVTDSTNSDRPLHWFLNLLIDKSPIWDGNEDTKHACRDTQEFFATVTNLLVQYKEAKE